MTAALELGPHDRVLEIGTGSGYAAAVLGRIAREVYTIERHGELADAAAARLRALAFDNVHVLHGDGTLGWREHAPYDAIVVTAGGPDIPEALLAQLAIGGRLVIPIGEEKVLQTVVRVTREADGSLRHEDLGDVRFVPLIGAQGWAEEEWTGRPAQHGSTPATVAHLVREAAEPVTGYLADVDVGSLLERIGDARLVLIGEATHGTSEFYALCAHITKALIRSHGFTIVAAEADWPDAARIHRYVKGCPPRRYPNGGPLRAFNVDVAQPRGARVRRVAARVERRTACSRRLLRPRSLQHVPLDPARPRLPRPRRPRGRAHGARALRMPHSLGGRPRDVRTSGAHGSLPRLRAGGRRDAAGPARP